MGSKNSDTRKSKTGSCGTTSTFCWGIIDARHFYMSTFPSLLHSLTYSHSDSLTLSPGCPLGEGRRVVWVAKMPLA